MTKASMAMTVGTLASLALAATGCGGSEPAPCAPGTSEGCPAGQVCEEVMGGMPACFAPLTIEGRVFDAERGTGIAGATVVAIDANGSARSTVVETGADGRYALPIAAPRRSDGSPLTEAITLRASAAGYQTYPTAPRIAIPIDLGTAADADGDGDLEVANAATDIALYARDDVAASAIVRGTIVGQGASGMLVLATQGERAVASAISDIEGAFVLFDVPVGEVTIAAYRAGASVPPTMLAVTAPQTNVTLSSSTAGLARVSGSVQIVDAPGGSSTSVILVLASTFVETTARGEAPPGLRAAPVSGEFAIDAVPPGDYVALAAFENDGLVRDPDTGIGGTSIVRFSVPAGGGTVELGESFKVTAALAVVSPGAETIESVSSATPTFRFAQDPSAERYEVRVYDAFGRMLHEDTSVPDVGGSMPISYVWTPSAPLRPGMIYQFRAWSVGRTGTYRSATEDLRGVFVYQP